MTRTHSHSLTKTYSHTHSLSQSLTLSNTNLSFTLTHHTLSHFTTPLYTHSQTLTKSLSLSPSTTPLLPTLSLSQHKIPYTSLSKISTLIHYSHLNIYTHQNSKITLTLPNNLKHFSPSHTHTKITFTLFLLSLSLLFNHNLIHPHSPS